MDFASHPGVDWKALFRLTGFRYYFAGMFISLFGTGMNFAGVTWYILAETNSTVKVSLITILVTLPGLIVPPFGGVLIDRVDRRWLGIGLDLGRAGIVLGAAALAWSGHMALWQVYLMMLLLGVGFAVYWSTTNALVQEVIPTGQLVGANAAVLIAVQGGMMAAGALVGFVFERAGLAGILGIDGATYLLSAFCLLRLRRGYFPPHKSFGVPAITPSPTIEAPPEMTEPGMLPPIVEPGLVMGLFADIKEGLRYLRTQPRVRAIGLTYAFMMAGVLSANVLVAALAMLAVGHALLPYVAFLAAAVTMQALFGACRALGGVLTQSSIMSLVPRRLMGRTQSTFSVISTLLQVSMSFTLGWLGQHAGLPVAFAVLGLLYSGAVVAALRARALTESVSP